SGLFRSLLASLLQGDAEQTNQKALIIVPSADDMDELHGLGLQGLLPETPERIIDNLRRGTRGFQDITRVVIACPAEDACAAFSADIQFIYSKAGFTPHTIVFTDKLNRNMHPVRKLLARPKIIAKKDITFLSSGQANAEVSPENVQDFLREARKKIYAEDPGVLLMYRKLFTQNVPLLSRSTMAAWLLKYLVEKNGNLSQSFPAGRRTPSRADMRMLFFGFGKNRKVLPRDISGLILSKFPEMDKNDIGDIRILDSYSFVEVTEKLASAVIEALNGTEYRGKTLAVNYARKKET
ncbi:MAG: DbpA RNA binding domain-containing protein, partial [Spirochaetaceae bacterium]|nr:DbpA RNA binding domain-containing protein [Spirochaetaceae bacterium]